MSNCTCPIPSAMLSHCTSDNDFLISMIKEYGKNYGIDFEFILTGDILQVKYHNYTYNVNVNTTYNKYDMTYNPNYLIYNKLKNEIDQWEVVINLKRLKILNEFLNKY